MGEPPRPEGRRLPAPSPSPPHNKGVYTLILRSTGREVPVGRLGSILLPEAYLIYVGSALGPGGLGRVQRHLAMPGSGKQPHWHIDYLLLDKSIWCSATITAATPVPSECLLANTIGGQNIPGFGCSDCSCRSHLFLRHDDPVESIEAAFSALGLEPMITRY